MPISLINKAVLLLSVIGFASACNHLRIRDWDLNDIGDTQEVNAGELVALICDGTCQGPGYTPSLAWIRPGGRKVQSFPGRLMSVYQESRRQIKLYLQDFQPSDQGVYTCRGWVNGKWRTNSVLLKSSVSETLPISTTPDGPIDTVTVDDDSLLPVSDDTTDELIIV